MGTNKGTEVSPSPVSGSFLSQEISHIIQDKNLICLLSHYTHQSQHFFVCDMILSASQIPPSQKPSQWPCLFFVAHFLGIWFHFQAQHQLGPLHTYRAPDHLESGSAWRALRSGFIRQCGRWGIGPPQLQTPRRAILAIPTTTHNNLQIPARGCAFLKKK